MKYKLIKEYPGSPKLDTICKYDKNPWSDSNAFTNPVLNPKYYPEFWQEVIEKNYEILSFINVNNKIYELRLDGRYFNDELKYNDYEYCLEVLKIHSVKRLSDGEIFTIGDKVDFVINSNLRKDTIHKIKSIELNPNGIVFRAENSSWSNYLNEISKIKKPLFTTEDGVDIFENIIYYGMNKGDLIMMKLNSKDIILDDNRCVTFSTKEKAEEYILLNKPCLSYGEVQEYLKVKDCNKLKDLVKLKIQQSV